MKTWKIEAFVAAIILFTPLLFLPSGYVGWIGTVAVFVSFLHGQVAERLSSKQISVPSKGYVPCHKWERIYFLTKEVLWLGYFIVLQAWPALIGVGLFILYRIWRMQYTAWRDKKAMVEAMPQIQFKYKEIPSDMRILRKYTITSKRKILETKTKFENGHLLWTHLGRPVESWHLDVALVEGFYVQYN